MPSEISSKKVLIVSQVFPPDPAAVGQHLFEVAAALVQRGVQVDVYSANRGYEKPQQRFPAHECIAGVNIKRLPFSSMGKRSMLLRLAAQISFLLQATLCCLFSSKASSILISTSPPMCAALGLILKALRGTPFTYWLMDLNPDQALAMGKFSSNSLLVKLLDALNRAVLKNAKSIIIPDRFMAERFFAKIKGQPGAIEENRKRIKIIPPWALRQIERIAPEQNHFRNEHHLEDKFVVMYSGNMSPASPLTPLLEAARELRHEKKIFFMFIGGGQSKEEVCSFISQHKLSNALCLPYQSLSQLPYSYSAADLHVATLGTNMVGIIHPCKAYGAMAIACPILFIGPKPSHLSELIEKYKMGWQVNPDDLPKLSQTILDISRLDTEELKAIGQGGLEAIQQELSPEALRQRVCNEVLGTH